MSPSSTDNKNSDDPYSYLEVVDSPENLDFAREANEKCLRELGDPEKSGRTETYKKVLAVLESDERIPHVSKMGVNEDGEDVLFNFWKDGKNPKGIWRKTTLSSYTTATPEWTTVLDIDALGAAENVSWVWKGYSPLQRSRDPAHSSQHVTRVLVKLSNGGADAITVREFDLTTNSFVEGETFNLPKEAKTTIAYKSRNVVSIGSDFGEGSLTDSGYPRTVREWVRGESVENAPVVFEGEQTDVSVGAYVDDQRDRGGYIYEVRYRSLDFYHTQRWARRVQFEHLLAPNDPASGSVEDPSEFVEVDAQQDAEVDFFGKWMLITLKSDWEVKGVVYPIGSLVAADAASFLDGGKEGCKEYQILFTPGPRTALEGYSATKNYLVLDVMDDVKSKLVFYRHDADTGVLTHSYGKDRPGQIRAAYVGGYDPRENDTFWFTTSSFTQPSTLSLADAALLTEETGEEMEDPFVTSKVKALPDMYDAAGLVVEQRFATSEDGTSVPYFLIRKETTTFEPGRTPTMLYGYGGFEISLTPHYTATSGVAWLERGGAYVEANIRGGGEFGPSWHQAALKEKRNKAYEDFIAVAEDLISSGLCSPSTLAIRGGSNGGLLMGCMLTMRPDLFGAIHCAVPLLDMKKYHKLLAGASWMAEYGDPDTDDWDAFLHKYSPYHNLKEDADYPPFLVTTSTRDDRVHPAHARKMVKKMWDMDKNNKWKVYYYENIEGGHGGAADSKQSAFMTALAFDFCWDMLTKNTK